MRRDGAIQVSPRGVAIHDRKGKVHSFEWTTVERILAYKLDLITTDDVCLEFLAGDRSYMAHEEAVGWQDLTAKVIERFPIPTSWLENVIRSPFATNMSVVWNRATQDALASLDSTQIEELWRLSRSDFLSDGALRDIYLTETAAEDWNNMLAVARGTFGPVGITSDARELKHDLTAKHFTGKKRAIVRLRAGVIAVTGYCFDASEIKLSFAPQELQCSSDLAQLLRFVISIACYLKRPAVIAPENARNLAIFHIQPTGEVEYRSPACGLSSSLNCNN
jgi:hypothetical protein